MGFTSVMKRWLKPQPPRPTTRVMSANAKGNLINDSSEAKNSLRNLSDSARPRSDVSSSTWSSVHTDLCSLCQPLISSDLQMDDITYDEFDPGSCYIVASYSDY
ncbi:hypothetical protein DSO57_1039533 [Entomophthora muscae]|uniref:Uncharacterized protein n=1 Tax=Entomophthora muscae TaxID=34485 RepID=A0ACC2UJ88_9FUNG|nr:hypothetical protein DSO57_1039533 [Entomophthora muscae]